MTYGLVAIVKDAAASIEAMLDSAHRAGVTTATIVDTGSTDGTPRLIREHGFRTPTIVETGPSGKRRWHGWRVVRRKWRNFGHNRSQAFALARGTADWLLALDADMTVEIDPDFEPDPTVDAYLIEMREGGMSWRLPLLLRGDLPWESRGAVHEYTCLADGSLGNRVPTDKVRVTFPPTPSTPEKRAWHASMLGEELIREPDNPRTVFYLAQTYREMGDPRARGLYQRRAAMGGWDEEAWYAQYRAALLTDWPARAGELLLAWERRPLRLEPLYALCAELNLHDAHRTAYALAYQPDGSPPPPDDVLFIEPGVWEWGMAFQASIAAWWIGEREESARLSRQVLECPIPPEIRAAAERNLSL